MSTAAERIQAYLDERHTQGFGDEIDYLLPGNDDDTVFLTVSDLRDVLDRAQTADKLQNNIDGELARAFNQLTAMSVHTIEQVAALSPGTVVHSAEGFVYYKVFTLEVSAARWGSDNWQMAGSEIGFSDKDIELPAKVLR